MARQLNINLVFNANTALAKLQMQSLLTTMAQLNSSMANSISMNGFTSEISKAQSALINLKSNLNSAFDVNTGKLDLTKFDATLKKSNMTLRDYRLALTQLGPEGQRAFNLLSQSILLGQMPLLKTKNLLTTMMDTFGNSIKWSIAYGAINKITQGIREAFNYANELNSSLTNIRVVTGLGAEEMTKFADKANKAAKSLATSTTAYTDAALIYYQQGLEGEAVEKRAETTLKLANVTGQSAQEISQNLTAVWNNFYDGSESLEYYADVMTALGAATASSSKEIAEGLEKFAAVADTVGLSYEYATTALATVTAQTRLSADVVGTAFKTLFARILDLELGETLEDGTTLGSYSQALAKVGVDIKTTNGELKNMDTILDEMGAKWLLIDKDLQVALAKSVAGIRQYTQLIALMDNWDTFEMNLTVAENAEGTLLQQQDIWAESWDAALKRVRASAEELYSSLIDDSFFIDLNNIFADLLSAVNGFVDAIGGLRTLLPMIGGLLIKHLGPMAMAGITNFTNSLTGPSLATMASAALLRTSAITELSLAGSDSATQAGTATSELYREQLGLVESIEGISRHLTNAEVERLKILMDLSSAYIEQINLIGLMIDKRDAESNALRSSMTEGQMGRRMLATGMTEQWSAQGGDPTLLRHLITQSHRAMMGATRGQIAVDEFLETGVTGAKGNFSPKKALGRIDTLRNNTDAMNSIRSTNPLLASEIEGYDAKVLGKAGSANIESQLRSTNLIDSTAVLLQLEFEQLAKKSGVKGLSKDFKSYTTSLRDTGNAMRTVNTNTRANDKAQKGLDKSLKQGKNAIRDYAKEAKAMAKIPLGETIMATVSATASLAAGLSMMVSGVESAIDMFETGEHSLSGWLGVITSAGFGFMMLSSGVKALGGALGILTLSTAALSAVLAINNKAVADGIALDNAEIASKRANALATIFGITAEEAKNLVDELGNLIKSKAIALSAKAALAKFVEATADSSNVVAKLAHAAANWALTASMTPVLAITLLIVAAMAVLIAIIVVVTKVIGAITDAYNADAIAAEEAKKQAEETAAAYSKVKLELEELKTALEDYNKAQNAILTLKEGTDEWRQAILESNNSILELLDTYPELAKYVDNVDGRLIITDENLLKMVDEMTEKVALMNNINQNALLKAALALQKSNVTNTVRAIDKADVDEDNIRKALDQFLDAYGEMGSALFEPDEYAKKVEELKTIDEDLVEIFEDNKEAIEKLIVAEENLVDREAILNLQKVDNLLYGQKNFVSDRYGKGIQEEAAKIYDEAYAEVEKQFVDPEKYIYGGSWEEWWTFGAAYATDEGEKDFAEYALLMGYEDAESTDFKSDRVVFEYKDEDGEIQEKEVKYEDMQDALKELAMAKHAAEITAKVNQMTSKVVDLALSDNVSDLALANFLENGNLDYLDPALASKISEADITDEEAQNFGYKSALEVIDAFNKEMENYDPVLARSNMLAKKAEEIDTILTAGAEELEISKSALEMYAASLVDTSAALEGEEETAAKLAVSHYRLAKGINDLLDSFKKYSKVLKEGNKNSLDYYEALGALKELVEKTFGLKVSADFMESNLPDLEAMANGDEEALLRLQKSLVSDYVLHLNIDESYRNALNNELLYLMDLAEGAEINTKLTLDSSLAIDAINTALRTGEATIQDIESLFNNANLAMPEYKIAQVPHTSTTKTNTTSTVNILGAEIPIHSEGTTTTTTYSDVPYFGDNPPTFDENGQMTDAGGGGSLKVTTTGNIGNLQDVLDYEGDGEVSETSSEKAKRAKELDEEIERYRLLNETVEDLERNLDNIGKAKDRAYGGAKIGYMQAERKELERNVELAKERLRLAEEYYLQDLQELSQYGIHANEDGQIENWDEILQKQINKMKGMDPNSDAYKDEEQRLDDMQSAYDKYMQSLDDVKDAQLGIIDTQNAVIDSLLEEAEFNVEFKIEADEFTIEALEHFLTRLKDNAFKTAEAIATIGLQMEITAGQVDTYITGIQDVLGATLSPEEIQKVMSGDLSGIDVSKLTELQIEDLKEYANGLMEVENQLREQHTAVHEKLTESIEAWNEEFDKNMAKFEKYNALVENYKNIIDIVGKGTLGISDDTMRNMYATQKNIALDLLEAARIRKESAQNTYDEIKAAYDSAVAQYGKDSEIAKKWKEQMDIAEESLDEATSEFLDAWQSALLAAADAFLHNVETIIQNFEKSIAGIYGSLEGLEEAMERQKEINERYLLDYEKTYEINKLNRKITQDIAKTTSNKSAKELRDLQNELLKMNKEGNQISKLDIEYMQKKYDLLLAEQALRDAQNAKSTVKLSRDSEGNYSYVYTADLNNVDLAMLAYEDAKYALEDWSRTSLDTVSENIIQIYSAWSQAMQEIMLDNTLSEEERERKMAETNQYYLDLMAYYTDEAAKLTEYGYQTNSQYHIDMADSINDSVVRHIMPDITDWKLLYTKYSGEMEKATNDLNGAILQFKKDIDTNLVAAGGSAKTFETTMNLHLLNVLTQAGTTKDAIIKIKTEAEAQLPLAVDAAKTFETNFNSHLQNVMTQIGDANSGLIKKVNDLAKAAKDALAAMQEADNYTYNSDPEELPGGDDNDGIPPVTDDPSDTTVGTYTVKLGTASEGARNSGYVKVLDVNTGKYVGYTHKNNIDSLTEDGRAEIYQDAQVYKYLVYKNGKVNTGWNKGVYFQSATGLGLSVAAQGAQTRDFWYNKNERYKSAWDTGADSFSEMNKIYIDDRPYYWGGGVGSSSAGVAFYPSSAFLLDPTRGTYQLILNSNGILAKYDTGGYTGSWGPEGRLAMLHQKEIVLNAHDTENLLSIISMVRDMSDRIELNARAMQYGLTAAYTANNIKSQNDALQLEVHITAEFPNATNHSEIEEAFRNLTNLASQYANRKF